MLVPKRARHTGRDVAKPKVIQSLAQGGGSAPSGVALLLLLFEEGHDLGVAELRRHLVRHR